MPMIRVATLALAFTCGWCAAGARGDEYAGAKLVQVSAGRIVFEHDGKRKALPVGVQFKLFDDQGEEQDPVTGVGRFLQPGNVVDIKAEAERRSRTPRIVEIRFVSGKVAELPMPPEKVDLRPDPKYGGSVIDSGGYTRDARWQAYIPQAKVGDFVEYHRGDPKEPGRVEAVEVGKDYVVIAKVFLVLGTREEQREKHRLPPPGADPNPAPLDGLPRPRRARPTAKEELTIAGKKVPCDVESRSGEPYRWTSADVPFDGLVKYVPRDKVQYLVTDFGRGEE